MPEDDTMSIDPSLRRALRGFIIATAVVLIAVTASLYVQGTADGEPTTDLMVDSRPLEPPRADGLETAVFALG